MGEAALEKLIVWLIILFFFFVLPNILQALVKRKAKQAAAKRGRGDDEADEREYAADADEIARYLESIGVKVQRRPPPSAEPAPQAPAAPPPRPREPVQLQPWPAPVAVQAPPPPPPRPQPRPAQRPQPPPRPAQPVPTYAQLLERAPTIPAAPAPARRRAAVRLARSALRRRPTRQELRRGVILAEILRRPDFDRFPCDRDLP